MILAALVLAQIEDSRLTNEANALLDEVNRVIKVTLAKKWDNRYVTTSHRSIPFKFGGREGSIAFSKKHDMRPFSIRIINPRSTFYRPIQGDRFGSPSDWEQYAFSLVHRIWDDVDGFVTDSKIRGELGRTIGGGKLWDSDSNTVFFRWTTHPIRNLKRDFTCHLERATGFPINITCQLDFGFSHPNPRIRMDNSMLRKTNVTEPSIFLIAIPPAPEGAGRA